jgi:hypothetical protein
LLIALLGCGGVLFVCMLICGGALAYGIKWGMDQVNAIAGEYENKGYKRHFGQVVEVGQSPTEKTVYVCQLLTVTDDVEVDIAIVSQVAELKANIHGDVDFAGQVLKLEKGCTIDGDLRIKNAQAIEIEGEVKGDITGNYMMLKYGDKTYGPGQSPSSPSGDKSDPPPPKPPTEVTPAPAKPVEPISPEAPEVPKA